MPNLLATFKLLLDLTAHSLSSGGFNVRTRFVSAVAGNLLRVDGPEARRIRVAFAQDEGSVPVFFGRPQPVRVYQDAADGLLRIPAGSVRRQR